MADPSKVVLITGCSTGIGRATALRLKAAGYPVAATARRVDTLADLAAAGCLCLPLDVTDEASCTEAVRRTEQELGPIGILVNNAGYSQTGAVESVPIDKLRKQFETNVFGPMHLCRLVLPGMRRQRYGKIVQMSSMGGKVWFPGGGAYHGSKHALEVISDALRYEVARFGVDVVIVEPGLIRTAFADAVKREMSDLPPTQDDPYTSFEQAVQHTTVVSYGGSFLAWFSTDADAVARAVERAIGRHRSPTRVPVTIGARAAWWFYRAMPDRLWDAAMSVVFPRPG